MTDLNAVLERLIRRDDTVRGSGQNPDSRAESNIIEFINKHDLHANESARRWLVDRAVTESYWVARNLMDTLVPLIQKGFHADALSIFCTFLARGDTERGAERRRNMLGRQSMFQPKIKEVVATKKLISEYPDSWGKAIVEVQADLLLDDQITDSSRRASTNDSDKPDYEDYSQRMYFERERKHEPVYYIAGAIENGLSESLHLASVDAFRILGDSLISTKWGLAKSQPLVALIDVAKESGLGAWQCEEASRLLELDAILESRTAHPWRRLLRCHLIPKIGTQPILHLAEAIRRVAENTRLYELSDFPETGVLTEVEIAEIRAARDANEVFEPYDPRELHESREASRWVGESSTDAHVNRWPYAIEHSAIRSLVDRKQPAKDIAAKDLEKELFNRINALRRVTERSEINEGEWFGEVLEWCGEAIADLKRWMELTHGISADKSVPIELYVPSLQEHCPWWKARADSAINRLREPPPRSHFEREHAGFSYGGGDPIAGSLKMLDELLAIPDGSRLDEYKNSLYTAICEVWSEWPLSTRGLAVWLLRPYHWRASNEMMELLVRVVESETDSEMIGFCLNHLLRFGRPGLTPLMQGILSRISTLSQPTDTAHLLGGVLGDAVVRYRAGVEELDELQVISAWFDEIRSERGLSVEVRQSLITSILASAERNIAMCEQPMKRHASEWVSLTNWGITEWLGLGADVHDTRHLPSAPVRFAREHVWSSEMLCYVLTELHDLLIRILREGGLGEFNSIHFELNEPVVNNDIVAETSKSSSGKLPVVAFMPDSQRLEICRASVDRVADWRREGKTTNDLAYGSSLSGQDSKKLLENCFDFSKDRNHVRRELVTIVDVLADAGVRNIANELRIKLRQANE